ncbi:MAG: tripartite tricarboxylate transporter TctB family protein [Betaproteobacteria bacterium]|nr:tripartite tricarboxylate transporter TctB family protein [Betaproteobacteria bacterium]PWB57884.1 MAG: tripartite tricarboxylate transporter TctB family protein [Betaproteobacteria bacterium]
MPGARTLRAGFLLAILFLAAGYTWVAFAELSYLSSAGRLGPGFMPRIIGVSLVAMCVLSLYLDIRRQPDGEALSPGWKSAAVLAALSGAFVVLLELLGGLLSMIAFMAASLWVLNPRRHLQNALVSILLPAFLQVVFAVWLRASMPAGLLPLPF